ncbi:MAG: hypothetical protein K2M43_00740, partial [Mycoplasmoidaceae bacterium]|nr:hypothetical protein [Mycoplasmoidaceae bacterium]
PDSSFSIVLNAANEEAIKLFEQNKIKFNEIIDVIKFAINNIKIIKIKNIQEVYVVDQLVRNVVNNKYQK